MDKAAGSQLSTLPPSSLVPAPTNSPDQEAFRYDGPKPQFKESAIISLADGVEDLRAGRAAGLVLVDDYLAVEGEPEADLAGGRRIGSGGKITYNRGP